MGRDCAEIVDLGMITMQLLLFRIYVYNYVRHPVDDRSICTGSPTVACIYSSQTRPGKCIVRSGDMPIHFWVALSFNLYGIVIIVHERLHH